MRSDTHLWKEAGSIIQGLGRGLGSAWDFPRMEICRGSESSWDPRGPFSLCLRRVTVARAFRAMSHTDEVLAGQCGASETNFLVLPFDKALLVSSIFWVLSFERADFYLLRREAEQAKNRKGKHRAPNHNGVFRSSLTLVKLVNLFGVRSKLASLCSSVASEQHQDQRHGLAGCRNRRKSLLDAHL